MRSFILSLLLLPFLTVAASAVNFGWIKDDIDDYWYMRNDKGGFSIDSTEAGLAYAGLGHTCPEGSAVKADLVLFAPENNYVPQHVKCDGTIETSDYTLEQWLVDVGGEIPEKILLHIMTH